MVPVGTRRAAHHISRQPHGRPRAARFLACLAIACLVRLPPCFAWRSFELEDNRLLCDQIRSPRWPMAYSKFDTHIEELKGRYTSSLQDFRHKCTTRGARSICHVCEDIVCGAESSPGTCSMQLQGVAEANLPFNIPTSTDIPFALGPDITHRYDYENASVVCLWLQGGDCVEYQTSNFTDCSLRCWGWGFDPPVRDQFGWSYPKDIGLPQGRVDTLAGSPGNSGHSDGAASDARFDAPEGVAVDEARNVYVADTMNHAIRMVAPDGTTTTLAGVPKTPGERDGPGATALFSKPTGITLYHDASDGGRVVIFVADTGNHLIRRIVEASAPGTGDWVVETWAGGGAARADGIGPAGLQDGYRTMARFNLPHGLAVDDLGNLFVADTNNHVVRFVNSTGHVFILAGTVRSMRTPTSSRDPEDAGCPDPCIEGVPGFIDGPRNESSFSFPADVALGENNTVVVADAHRIRRITRSNEEISTIQGISSFNRVVTLAGSLEAGSQDGDGVEARFDSPKGVFMDAGGRIYVADTLRCRIRRITPADHVAQPLTCRTKLTDVLRPSGCASYDPPVDLRDDKGWPVVDNIYHNYNASQWRQLKIQQCLGTPPDDTSVSSTGLLVAESSMIEAVTGVTTVTRKEQVDDGTRYRFRCPPGCAAEAASLTLAGQSAGIFGTDYYADVSRVCAAAAHAGVIGDEGGLVSVLITRSFGPNAGPDSVGYNVPLNATVRNGIQSEFLEGWVRSFVIEPYPLHTEEVGTISGSPNAPLSDPCGFRDSQPSQEAQFHTPVGIALYRHANLSDTDFLYVADSKNHVIRKMTAVCSKICENGGRCVAAETCACPPGWAGDDCTTPVCADGCPTDQICVGGTCMCKPGYSGPDCLTPLCVQDCLNGGSCGAPDTCNCPPGWFDPTCNTPVCKETCGNGGNCTAPDTCTCPSEWTGRTCRTPVCSAVTCLNGGVCVAPDTCRCPYGWSGHDCSKPVCTQGFFRQDPVPQYSAPTPLRPLLWNQYIPCEQKAWCNATNEFDCRQIERQYVSVEYDPTRNITGFYSWGLPPTGECFAMELDLLVDLNRFTPYRLEYGNGTNSPYRRYSPEIQYPWDSTQVLSNGTSAPLPWSAPFAALSDRQIALVQYLVVDQGVYACANGGDCVAPDTCLCAPGWSGFDCRTPVCSQGWYNFSRVPVHPVTGASPRYLNQGSYRCSTRAVTVWENPPTPNGKFEGYVHYHPNYYSRHMNNAMGWPAVHVQLPPSGNDTLEGWRRVGLWERTDAVWEYGICPHFSQRECEDGAPDSKITDLRDGVIGLAVNDTEFAFGPRVNVTDEKIIAVGRWEEAGGECIDHVLNGCFNGGTCVAPDECICAPGWEGHDCSVPVCSQSVEDITDAPDLPLTLVRADGVNVGNSSGSPIPPALPGDIRLQYRECPNRGNCTHPDTCTCEKGWGGPQCTIPLCAQECFNGGECILPDTCMCKVWYNEFRDNRGVPVFQKDNGDPQLTGWTGYDCNTPICVQAESFVLNDEGSVVLVNSSNSGRTFQAACPGVSRFTPPGRTRESFVLCGLPEWYQGVYEETWANGLVGSPPVSLTSAGRSVRVNHANYIQISTDNWVAGPLVPGEGIYACFNEGSCVAPDTCECPDGWTDFNCNTPLCRHVNSVGKVVGCLNGGICGDRDDCSCIREPSVLWTVHPDEPEALTGYTGSDCSIAVCVQGFFDPQCTDVGPTSSGGEGCYRCANGGNCTAPDFCTCPPEWTGHDCRTPVCTHHADLVTLQDLDTVDPARVTQFELDPCGSELVSEIGGVYIGHGNCTAPDVCTCLCVDRTWRDKDGQLVDEPWSDPLGRSIPPGYIFGRFDCIGGYEGNLNDEGDFTSCHLKIYEPSWLERNSLLLIIICSCLLFFLIVTYIFIRRKLRSRYLLAKAEKRRSRRSSEEETGGGGAFKNN